MKIALLQMTSVLDYQENLKKIDKLLGEVSGSDVEAVFLPECFYSMSNGKEPTPYLIELGNVHYENIQKMAIKHNVALIGGTAATNVSGKVINRAYNFSSSGEDLGFYDKNHLFSCDFVKDGVRKKIDEGDIYTPGKDSKVLNFKNTKIGLGVCFDLRYSEMSLDYRMNGAEILTFSSAFTVPTGQAHWHTLLRARAIESQCYVIASAQWGSNNEVISTYGHSLVVDPWGEVLVDAKEGEGIFIAELDFNKVSKVRSQVIMGR